MEAKEQHVEQSDSPKEESSLTHSDIFRLRSCIVEIVEDLKLRKTVEKDNEDRINHLLSEKHELERNLESGKESRAKQEEKQQQDMVYVKQQCEEKLKALEEEQKQFQILKNCAEKDMATMREEARLLQLSKYKAEKRVKELESKLSSQEQQCESQTRQVTGLEAKVSAVKTHHRRLEGSQSRLDKNVEEAVKLNKTLMGVNRHQQCVIDQLRHEHVTLRGQLMEARAANQMEAGDVMKETLQLREEIHRLQVNITALQMERTSTKKELDSCRENWQKAVVNLKTAQHLVQQHHSESVEQQSKLEESENTVQGLRQQLDHLGDTHQDTVEEMATLGELRQEQERGWKEKLSQSEETCAQVREELQTTQFTLTNALNEVDTLTNTLTTFTTQLNEARAKLNVERAHTLAQTDSSVFLVSCVITQTDRSDVSVGVQVTSEMANTSSQTERAERAAGCQTAGVDSKAVGAQTFVPSLISEGTQCAEDRDAFREMGVQTESPALCCDKASSPVRTTSTVRLTDTPSSSVPPLTHPPPARPPNAQNSETFNASEKYDVEADFASKNSRTVCEENSKDAGVMKRLASGEASSPRGDSGSEKSLPSEKIPPTSYTAGRVAPKIPLSVHSPTSAAESVTPHPRPVASSTAKKAPPRKVVGPPGRVLNRRGHDTRSGSSVLGMSSGHPVPSLSEERGGLVPNTQLSDHGDSSLKQNEGWPTSRAYTLGQNRPSKTKNPSFKLYPLSPGSIVKSSSSDYLAENPSLTADKSSTTTLGDDGGRDDRSSETQDDENAQRGIFSQLNDNSRTEETNNNVAPQPELSSADDIILSPTDSSSSSASSDRIQQLFGNWRQRFTTLSNAFSFHSATDDDQHHGENQNPRNVLQHEGEKTGKEHQNYYYGTSPKYDGEKSSSGDVPLADAAVNSSGLFSSSSSQFLSLQKSASSSDKKLGDFASAKSEIQGSKFASKYPSRVPGVSSRLKEGWSGLASLTSSSSDVRAPVASSSGKASSATGSDVMMSGEAAMKEAGRKAPPKLSLSSPLLPSHPPAPSHLPKSVGRPAKRTDPKSPGSHSSSSRWQAKYPRLQLASSTDSPQPKASLPVVKKSILKGNTETESSKGKTVTFAPAKQTGGPDWPIPTTPTAVVVNSDSSDDQILFSDNDDNDIGDNPVITPSQCQRIVGMLLTDNKPETAKTSESLKVEGQGKE